MQISGQTVDLCRYGLKAVFKRSPLINDRGRLASVFSCSLSPLVQPCCPAVESRPDTKSPHVS